MEKYLIFASITVFIFLAYSPGIKRYLPNKIYYKTPGSFSYICHPYRKFGTKITAITPFMSVSTSINIDNRNHPITLKIKASKGKNSAVCTNIDDLNKVGFNIGGNQRSKRIELRTSEIRYGNEVVATFARR